VQPEKPTIVCVSANPALDRRVRLAALVPGEVNRAKNAVMMPGGKSAHVAMTARALGVRAAWLGFSGGSTGDENEAGLARLGIEVNAIRTAAATRVNLEAIEDSGAITELLEPGGPIAKREQNEMLRVCEERLRSDWKGAAVAISGSLPGGIAADFYASIIRLAHAAGSSVFLDTSGDALRESLTAAPDFVKPNRHEAEQLLGVTISTEQEAMEAARLLIEQGAVSAAITLGSAGLVWKENRGGACWAAKPPRLKPISTVGCGDATMGGFAYAAQTGLRGADAVRLAAACGAANCLAKLSGQVNEADVKALLPQIDVQQIDL
jgi:1-phosphofructokinase family hexose kinase